MLTVDRYTKIVLSIIAGCLIVLCFEHSPWGKLEAVQAQQPFVIEGYTFDESGTQKTYHLGNGSGEKPGIPVVASHSMDSMHSMQH